MITPDASGTTLICVVLCGGAGSRLWPLSRDEHPKPFIVLPDGRSLIQEAYLNAASLPECHEIITVTNFNLHFKAAEAYAALDLGVPASQILEPVARNTAPAVSAAALSVNRDHGAEAVMLVLAADHLITDRKALGVAVGRAIELARRDRLVAFGLKPTRPETGFGYIEAAEGRVTRFIEKPDQEAANRYFADGGFYWNAGLVCCKAGVMLEELRSLAPDILESVERAFEGAAISAKNGRVVELDREAFASSRSISLDYAVLERSSRVAMVPCDLGWDDIGNWRALAGLYPKDDLGNHVSDGSKVLLEDARGCDIHAEDRLVACLGLDNALIVDTSDAVLVASRDRVQDVRALYQTLKDCGSETSLRHRTVYRPWGSYTLLGEGPRFKIKRLVIKPGGSLSLQMHRHRSEHWVVVSGSAEVVCGERTFFLDTNQSTYIKAGHFHRVSNRGLIDLTIIEVQSGDYLEEDDITRLEDAYGRG